MIPKSGNRFSDRIMLNQKDGRESDSTQLSQALKRDPCGPAALSILRMRTVFSPIAHALGNQNRIWFLCSGGNRRDVLLGPDEDIFLSRQREP
jgi:hypothetical protein